MTDANNIAPDLIEHINEMVMQQNRNMITAESSIHLVRGIKNISSNYSCAVDALLKCVYEFDHMLHGAAMDLPSEIRTCYNIKKTCCNIKELDETLSSYCAYLWQCIEIKEYEDKELAEKINKLFI